MSLWHHLREAKTSIRITPEGEVGTVTTIQEFLEANEDLGDEWIGRFLDIMERRQPFFIGGGAAPVYRIEVLP